MSKRQFERSTKIVDPLIDSVPVSERMALDEKAFRRIIAVERKRTERSKSPFVLMLLEVSNPENIEKSRSSLECILAALVASCRDTDLVGWYKDRSIVGVMFTGLLVNDKNSVLSAILNRVSNTLHDELTFEQFSQVSITFHFFPDDWEEDGTGRPSNSALYPDLVTQDSNRKSLLVIKRAFDLAVSSIIMISARRSSWELRSRFASPREAPSFSGSSVWASMAGRLHS